jgi:hypothetical protein
MSDEVTVSSLPHPISMFFLGIFAVTIIFVTIEVFKMRKEWEKFKNDNESKTNDLQKFIDEFDSKIFEVSKKVDSRVDKALLNLKKSSH